MKLTALFLGLTAARLDAMGSKSANMMDANGALTSEQSMGAGIVDHTDDQFNQLSKAPTPAPSGDSEMHDALHDSNADETGSTDQIDEQTGVDAIPTKQPTSFPTKDQAEADAFMDTHDVNWGWAIQSQTRDGSATERKCAKTSSRRVCSGRGRSRRCRTVKYCSRYQQVAVTDVCQATVSPDGEELCITDGSSYYENEEVCRFTFTGEGALLNKEFDLERRWDTMTIAGTSYDGRSNAMNNLALTGTTAFKFESDSDTTRRGFKFCVALPTESKGSVCTSTVAWADGSTTKPVGWVGAGPGADYCNIWKCEIGESEFTEQDFTGTFRKQVRQCSIEEHGDSFCSHTSCTFSGSPEVIRVHSDHREEVGGFHKCGLSQHALARSADRPACDCICHGARRQDADGFARSLNDISDEVTNALAVSPLPEEMLYNFDFGAAGDFEGDTNIQDTTTYMRFGSCKRYSSQCATSKVCPRGKTRCSGRGRRRSCRCTVALSCPQYRCAEYHKIFWDEVTGECAVSESPYGGKKWHVHNKQCTLTTANAWVPVLPDSYHTCKFSLEVIDLDTTYFQKEATDKVCFQVLDADGQALNSETCQSNDISTRSRSRWETTISTEFINIPDTGVKVRMTANSDQESEHWYSDNLKITCKDVNRIIEETDFDATTNNQNNFDAEANSNNFYSQHSNTAYNEKDHTYDGELLAHAHIDN